MFTDCLHRYGGLPPTLRLVECAPQGFRFPSVVGSGCDRAEATLAALHADGAGWSGRWTVLCAWLGSLLRPVSSQSRCHDYPWRRISAECGALLYQLARLGDTRLAVVLGVGNGAAAIWLASAMRANHRHSGDRGIIACEPTHQLAQLARRRLRAAGVSRYVDLHEGQPEQALARIDQPVDCLLLNGYPALMLAVLGQLQSRLRPGALVMALRPAGNRSAYDMFLRHVRDPSSGFTSIALPYRENVELSVRA